MRKIRDISDINGSLLGPGTDLVISLVAILVLMIAVFRIELATGDDKTELLKKEVIRLGILIAGYEQVKIKYEKEQRIIEKIKQYQTELINQIGSAFFIDPKKIEANEFQVFININLESITIENDVATQRISFGASILFEKDSSVVSRKGKQIIEKVGTALILQLKNIQEIQILGHADISGEEDYNLNLASKRAISVLQILQNEVGIDPSEKILSATSYGEFMPVARSYNDPNYNLSKLKRDNANEKLRSENRRIEIVIKFNTDLNLN